MIDAHCHVDMYKDPNSIARESERLGITTIGMTHLPSHFELGYHHVLQYKRVRLALGMHPLKSQFHSEEFDRFFANLDKTSYIGEIGLDYSKEGIQNKEIQLESFKKILNGLRNKKKILSVHSRKAEKDVLTLLTENTIPIAIFHWYTGPIALISKILNAGYYFSINPAMTRSINGKKIIKEIPQDRVLTESDGPYANYNGTPTKPKDVFYVQEYLAKLWRTSTDNVNEKIDKNFSSLINILKS